MRVTNICCTTDKPTMVARCPYLGFGVGRDGILGTVQQAPSGEVQAVHVSGTIETGDEESTRAEREIAKCGASPKTSRSESKEDGINETPSNENPGSEDQEARLMNRPKMLIQYSTNFWLSSGPGSVFGYSQDKRDEENDVPTESPLDKFPANPEPSPPATRPSRTPQLPMAKNNKPTTLPADSVITQVASEMSIFGPIDGDCYGKIHERVYATANDERDAATAGKPLRIRPARITSDQAAYLGSYNAPTGEQIHRVVLLNTDFELFNSATGEMVRMPGHFFGQLHPIPRYGPRPPMVPRVSAALVEGCVRYAQTAATNAAVNISMSPSRVKGLTSGQRLHLPAELQQDSLRITVDSTAGMTADFSTISPPAVITDNGQRQLTYGAQYQLKNEDLKVKGAVNDVQVVLSKIQTFDPRKRPATPANALPMVLYTGLTTIPEVEEGEIIQNGCIDPQYVHAASNVQVEETNQNCRRMLVRKVKSEPELFHSHVKEVRTEYGEISERSGSAPPLLPHFPSTASTPSNENAQHPKEDLHDYVMVPAPRCAYNPGCAPAQILEANVVSQPTPDRYTLTPMPFGISTAHSPRDSIYGSSDEDLPSLRYPESSTDDSSGNELSLHSLELATDDANANKNTPFSQPGYSFVTTREVVRAFSSLRRFAPFVVDPNHHANAWSYVHRDAASLYAYQLEAEQDEDEGAIRTGRTAIDMMQLDTTRMIDRFAMAQGKLYNYEDLRREREVIHEEQGRDLAAPFTPASIYLDEEILLVNKGCQHDVNESDLDQVSTRVGIGMRRIPDDAQPTADLYDQYPPVFSPEALEYGPAFRIAIMVAVNQRRNMVRILRSIRGNTCEFIDCTYDMIALRRMSIDLADAQRDGPAPLPFLRPLEHLKLRIIYHTYRRYGNSTISDVAGQLLQFVFREAESRATSSTPEQGWELEVHRLTAPTSSTSTRIYALITGVTHRVHLPTRTLTVVFRDNWAMRGSAVLPHDATAVLPMMRGTIMVHARLAGRRLHRGTSPALSFPAEDLKALSREQRESGNATVVLQFHRRVCATPSPSPLNNICTTTRHGLTLASGPSSSLRFSAYQRQILHLSPPSQRHAATIANNAATGHFDYGACIFFHYCCSLPSRLLVHCYNLLHSLQTTRNQLLSLIQLRLKHMFSLLALLSIQVFAEGIYILFYLIHGVIRLLAQELFRQVSKQLNTVAVYSIHGADLYTDHGQTEFPGAISLQDPGDEELLEEDDEFIFYPVSMKNEAGRHYQAFTILRRATHHSGRPLAYASLTTNESAAI
ncbi:hypothetical protein C8R45DRAFT_933490 [Mycena sanguinolenta]|nr:hypothetical protein C8R45DRAFT_933490 [Mycena sanguinolenta]